MAFNPRVQSVTKPCQLHSQPLNPPFLLRERRTFSINKQKRPVRVHCSVSVPYPKLPSGSQPQPDSACSEEASHGDRMLPEGAQEAVALHLNNLTSIFKPPAPQENKFPAIQSPSLLQQPQETTMRAERIIQTISSLSEIGLPAAIRLRTETNVVFLSSHLYAG